jgi:hypothetical protein
MAEFFGSLFKIDKPNDAVVVFTLVKVNLLLTREKLLLKYDSWMRMFYSIAKPYLLVFLF